MVGISTGEDDARENITHYVHVQSVHQCDDNTNIQGMFNSMLPHYSVEYMNVNTEGGSRKRKREVKYGVG